MSVFLEMRFKKKSTPQLLCYLHFKQWFRFEKTDKYQNAWRLRVQTLNLDDKTDWCKHVVMRDVYIRIEPFPGIGWSQSKQFVVKRDVNPVFPHRHMKMAQQPQRMRLILKYLLWKIVELRWVDTWCMRKLHTTKLNVKVQSKVVINGQLYLGPQRVKQINV